ncbi:MAG: hypothetical protein NVSMB19_09440 [Vulcanimicrobiaceae bacterium]
MRSDCGRNAVAAAFAAGFAVALAVLPAGGATVPAPVNRTCANDRLPSEILDGPVARPAAPLRTIDVAAPAARLHLAVADDERTRETGLMCVTRLRGQRGMIFVFPRDDTWEFWMKNTLVPLDMVWVDAGGEVTAVAAGVPAATVTTRDAALPRRRGRGTYVIELGANEAAADGIRIGTHLVLPPLRAPR